MTVSNSSVAFKRTTCMDLTMQASFGQLVQFLVIYLSNNSVVLYSRVHYLDSLS